MLVRFHLTRSLAVRVWREEPGQYTPSRRLVIVIAMAIVRTICTSASVNGPRLLFSFVDGDCYCITSTYTLEIVIEHILRDLLPEHCSILTRSPEVDTGETRVRSSLPRAAVPMAKMKKTAKTALHIGLVSPIQMSFLCSVELVPTLYSANARGNG